MDFEWRTEEEGGWEETPATVPAAKSRRRRPWRALLVVFLILGLAGVATAWQLQRRVAVTTDSLRADVLASHRLVQQAAARGDAGLFESLLSDRDRQWYRMQQMLLEHGLVLDRGPLGLWFLPAAEADTTNTQVLFSPDYLRAEVSELRPHAIEVADGITETVTLQRTAVYTRRDERWLLAPPADMDIYWGGWISVRRERTTVVMPARDEAIGRRLAADLDALVARFCDEAIIDCRRSFALELRLEREAHSLMDLSRGYNVQLTSSFLSGTQRLVVPAPSLVGVPVDEAGYQALYRGYAAWLASILAYSSDGLVAWQEPPLQAMARLGLRPPPLPGYSPLVAREAPPVPWPEQELLLLCRSSGRGLLWRYDPAADSWLEEPARGQWVSTAANVLAMLPLADGSDLVLQVEEEVDGIPHWRTVLWADGREQLLLDAPQPYTVIPGHWRWGWPSSSASGNYLALHFPAARAAEVSEDRLLDLEACTDQGCQLLEAEDIFYWSPGRRHSLIVATGEQAGTAIIYEGDSSGRRLARVGPGWSPIWLDDQTYSYVRPAGPLGDWLEVMTEVVIVTVGNASGEPTVSFNSDDLAAAVAAAERTQEPLPDRFTINSVSSHAARPDQLFVSVVAYVREQPAYATLVIYDLPKGEITLPLQGGGFSWQPPLFSPGGRYLSSVVWGGLDGGYGLHVHDLEQGQSHTFTLSPASSFSGLRDHAWSVDEQWLVLLQGQMLTLIAPEQNYMYPVYHRQGNCEAAMWIDR